MRVALLNVSTVGWPGRKGEEGGGSEDPDDIDNCSVSIFVLQIVNILVKKVISSS